MVLYDVTFEQSAPHCEMFGGRNVALIAVAILSLAVLSGCPFAIDERRGFDLSLRVKELQSGQIVGGATAATGFCSVVTSNCDGVLTFGLMTDPDGVTTATYVIGPGCDGSVPNRLVVIIESGETEDRVELVVESAGINALVPGNDFIGERADGEVFFVEVLDCIDARRPL